MTSHRAPVRPRMAWAVGWIVAGLVAFVGTTVTDTGSQLGLRADHVVSSPAPQP